MTKVLFDLHDVERGELRERPQTQQEKILSVLRHGDWVSAWDISRRSQVLCYTKRISELRRAGHTIEMRWHTNNEGRKDYTEYRLAEEKK